MSEGDASGSFEVLNKLPASSSMDLTMMNEGRWYLRSNIITHVVVLFSDWEEESHEDSGMASSFEENIIVTTEKNNQVNNNSSSSVNSKPKSKRMTKRRSKQIQMANELIFDLDI